MKLIKNIMLIFTLVVFVESRYSGGIRRYRAGASNMECGENEEFTCSPCSETTCYQGEIVTCKYMEFCYEKCRCKPGFYRSLNGKCLSQEECARSTVDIDNCHLKHGANSYIADRPTCASKICLSDFSLLRRQQWVPRCNRYLGCICKDGFILHKGQICSRPDNCKNIMTPY